MQSEGRAGQSEGVPSFSTGKSSIKQTNLKVFAIPLNKAHVLNVRTELC